MGGGKCNLYQHLLQFPDEEDEEEEEEEEDEDEEEELNPDPDPDVVAAVPAPSNSPSITALAAANSENQNPQSIRYRECRKNHAANLGSHVLDGCGEFMPGGEEGTPQFLKCAACDCHRNFHRKESDAGPNFRYGSARTAIVHPVQAPPQRYSNNYNRHHHQSRRGPPPQVMLGFGGDAGAPAESSSEDLDALRSYHQQQQPSGQKKRFRTKFSEGQKERMLGFAEKLGWKIQKQDEEEVQQFCSDIGVKRKVFKVWMHNNKQSMEKKKKTPPPPPL